MKKVTKKQWVILSSCLLCVFLGLGLTFFSTSIKKTPYEQNLVSRWSDEDDFAQVSIFLSNLTSFMPEQMEELEYKLMEQLQTDAIVQDQEAGRLWLSAFSGSGTASLKAKNNSMVANAVGVGGDFFQFHPYYLREGGYFNGSDIITDRIVIDEEIAWALFGSNDVVGQYVWISEAPHVVVGVIQKEDDSLTKEAGGDEPTIYMSYQSLAEYGSGSGINCIEFLMIEKVGGYATKFLSTNIGINANDYEMVQNNKRYTFLNLLDVIGQFPTRSMNAKAIIYPVWENVAKGYEDILALILVVQIILFSYPSIVGMIVLYQLWKKRTWKASDIVKLINHKIYDMRANKKKKKKKI